ncbi:mitochondrial inner membrane protein Mitofilin [Pseudohyphozyma bogoriensis]|nr:mitochondrial inner membrane protein Mitofilin [Pseudohyphozyma bogoriensis]
MGASGSKVDVEVDGNDKTFFARRDNTVAFSDEFINHLSASSLPSTTEPSKERQATLDEHIQSKIASELARLQAQEASVRDEIERALERENFQKEAGTEDGPGVAHSATLMKDLEELEKRTLGFKEEGRKKLAGVAWESLEQGRKSLVECFAGNKETPLNCKEAADKFMAAVSGVEKTYATPTATPTPIKPKKSIARRVLTPIAALTILFYGVSVPLGFFSLRYRDFLVETVPLGEQLGDILDKYELSSNAAKLDKDGKPVIAPPAPGKPVKETELTRYAETKAKAEGWSLKKGEKADPEKAREAIKKKAEETSTKAAEALAAAKAKVGAKAQEAQDAAAKVETKVVEFASDVKEKALSAVPVAPKVEEPKSTLPVYAQRPRELDATPLPPKKANNEAYTGPPLPIGFEPAPGYEVRRPPPTPKGEIKPVAPPPAPLPLVAPAVKDVVTSEPILGQLASTIDSLAKFVENNTETVSTSAGSVLTAAQTDIKKLAGKIDEIKKAETEKLEASLKKQASDYSSLLLQAEKDLVSKLDTQEEDWKKAFDDERKNLVSAYKEKLERELQTQQEIINQRLKEEVVAQGIELQRRWVREVKTRVEQERGGRLAKLEELEGGLRKLEKVNKENEETLSEAHRARKIFAAVKAIEHKVETGAPFDEELRALQRFIGTSEDSLIALALASIPESVAASGIASFPALASRFNSSVAPQLRRVSLLPEDGGVLSYLTSYVGSAFLFQKEGWAEGDDVVSTIARANFWLANKDLDLAAREINALKGWPKALASDWLSQARRHLEVKQALDIAEGEATAESLKSI